MTGLVERLRSAARGLGSENPHDYISRGVSAGDCADAAAAITRLRGYARHDRGCLAIAVTAAGPCTCGLTALLADIEGKGQRP